MDPTRITPEDIEKIKKGLACATTACLKMSAAFQQTALGFSHLAKYLNKHKAGKSTRTIILDEQL